MLLKKQNYRLYRIKNQTCSRMGRARMFSLNRKRGGDSSNVSNHAERQGRLSLM